jgi:RimJ/RimL family protein N-acetyltransferase
MRINYRRLNPGDSKDYRDIRLESLKNHPDSFGSSHEEESMNPKLSFENYIEEKNPYKFIMGAFDNERLIGICGFFQETQKKSRHRGTIIQMYIKLEYAGKGIGSSLLKVLINEAFKIQEIEQLVIGVMANNESAKRIYSNAGFKEYGLHRNYSKVGEKYLDECFMILERKR